MAEDKQIGQLENGGTVQATDKIPVERGTTNAFVTVGTAGTKAATDATKDKVASVNGSTTAGHLAVFTDGLGTVGDGGEPDAIITGAPVLTPPALTTDLIPILRGGQIYLTTIEEVLAAQSPSGGAGQFDFSDTQNSAFTAII